MGMGGVYLRSPTAVKEILNITKIIDGTSHTIAIAEMRVGLSPRDTAAAFGRWECAAPISIAATPPRASIVAVDDDDLFGSATVF